MVGVTKHTIRGKQVEIRSNLGNSIQLASECEFQHANDASLVDLKNISRSGVVANDIVAWNGSNFVNIAASTLALQGQQGDTGLTQSTQFYSTVDVLQSGANVTIQSAQASNTAYSFLEYSPDNSFSVSFHITANGDFNDVQGLDIGLTDGINYARVQCCTRDGSLHAFQDNSIDHVMAVDDVISISYADGVVTYSYDGTTATKSMAFSGLVKAFVYPRAYQSTTIKNLKFSHHSGAKGDKGDKGDTGTAGIDGSNGSNGNDGAQGLQGLQGLQGSSGVVAANSPLSYDGVTQSLSVDLSSYATTSALSDYALTTDLASRLPFAVSGSDWVLNNSLQGDLTYNSNFVSSGLFTTDGKFFANGGILSLGNGTTSNVKQVIASSLSSSDVLIKYVNPNSMNVFIECKLLTSAGVVKLEALYDASANLVSATNNLSFSGSADGTELTFVSNAGQIEVHLNNGGLSNVPCSLVLEVSNC